MPFTSRLESESSLCCGGSQRSFASIANTTLLSKWADYIGTSSISSGYFSIPFFTSSIASYESHRNAHLCRRLGSPPHPPCSHVRNRAVRFAPIQRGHCHGNRSFEDAP